MLYSDSCTQQLRVAYPTCRHDQLGQHSCLPPTVPQKGGQSGPHSCPRLHHHLNFVEQSGGHGRERVQAAAPLHSWGRHAAVGVCKAAAHLAPCTARTWRSGHQCGQCGAAQGPKHWQAWPLVLHGAGLVGPPGAPFGGAHGERKARPFVWVGVTHVWLFAVVGDAFGHAGARCNQQRV